MKSVSVVIPVLNEEKYIEACIESVIAQDYPKDSLELLLVDGMSEDATREIIGRYTSDYDWIRMLDNEKRIIPAALNIGIVEARGEYIVRMDAHSEYATDYVSKCMEVLERTGADNVGGPQLTDGKNTKQKIIASAYSSVFALGGGKHFKKDYEGEADTVFLGAFKRSYAIEMGLFDEDLPRNEDDEFNYRIKKNGGRVYISPEIKSTYYPRDSFRALAKQYYGYGEGKPKVMKKHGKPSGFKQFVPALFVVFLAFGSVITVIHAITKAFPLLKKLFTIGLAVYGICNAIATFTNRQSHGIIEKAGLFWAHIVIHISYGAGYIRGLFKKQKKEKRQEVNEAEVTVG